MKVNGTKISKSLGNGYTLADLESRGFSALDFRMFVLQGHYKNEGNFTFEALEAAKNRLHNWRNAAALRHQTHDTLQSDDEKSTSDETVSLYTASQAVLEALNQDLGTPEALRIIDEAFGDTIKARLDEIDRRAFMRLLETIDNLLGLRLIDSTPDIDDESKQIILERNAARSQQDWAKADELRARLAHKGITLRDITENISIWEYSS